MSPFANSADVFIIGGGPAGLATAIAASRKGFQVVVADCSGPVIDKACGEGLMPDAVGALGQLGVHISAAESSPFRGIRFIDHASRVEASFPTGSGVGVRRTNLHRLLLDRAREEGVCFLWNARVAGLDGTLDGSKVYVNDRVVCARWVVGADGHNSLVRRWAGLDRYRVNRRRFAFRRHFSIAPWSDCVEVYWGANCQICVTPVGPGEVCAVSTSRNPKLRLERALVECPELGARLRGSKATSAERGAITGFRALRRVFRGSVVLVGDASGAIDAISGEGLCQAFQQAIVLASALEVSDLSFYQSRHRVLAWRSQLMTSALLGLDRFPTVRHGVFRALASYPALFARLLALHVGAPAARDSIAQGVSACVCEMPKGRALRAASAEEPEPALSSRFQ